MVKILKLKKAILVLTDVARLGRSFQVSVVPMPRKESIYDVVALTDGLATDDMKKLSGLALKHGCEIAIELNHHPGRIRFWKKEER